MATKAGVEYLQSGEWVHGDMGESERRVIDEDDCDSDDFDENHASHIMHWMVPFSIHRFSGRDGGSMLARRVVYRLSNLHKNHFFEPSKGKSLFYDQNT